MITRLLSVAAIAVVLLCGATRSAAAAIIYEVEDLPDVVAGEDLWQYRYSFDVATFPVDQGFTVYFDYTTVASIALPAGAGSDAVWDIFTSQPDSGIPDDGFYDALALQAPSAVRDPFLVNFVRLAGAPVPGTQFYEIYSIAGGTFDVLEDGLTQQVSEPVSLALVGLVAAAAWGRRGRHAAVRRQPAVN